MDEIFNITTLIRILHGIYELLFVAFISIILSILGGFIIGRLMIAKNIILRFWCKVFLDVVRIIPLIAWLFIVYYGVSSVFDLHISSTLSAVIVFSIWGMAEMSDLVRSGILSVPRHQRESSMALGFNAMQIELFIILPQSIIHILPSCVNLFGRIIKTTSLLPLIGLVEILKVGQQLIEVFEKNDSNVSFVVYGSILLIYFLLCYPFAYFGDYLQKRLSIYR